MNDLGLPDDILQFVNYPTRFDCRETPRPARGRRASRFRGSKTYAWRLWDYWERHLDPDLFVDRSLRGARRRQGGAGHRRLVGHRQGGRVQDRRRPARSPSSSRATRPSSRRRATKRRDGLDAASPTPPTSPIPDQCDALIAQVIAEHGGVDILVNNAGRSIRRGIENSLRPLSRLRAHDAAQLFRRAAGHHGLPAEHGAAQARPRHQYLVDRRADQRAALLGLCRVEGRARRLDALRGFRIPRPRRRISRPSTCRWCARR